MNMIAVVIGVLAGICIFLFVLLNFLYLRTNHSRNFFENADKFVAGVPKGLQMVATGSSYAKFDIDFTQDVDKFNFGVFPQSLHYDYKILQQYHEYMERDCIVIVTLAPLNFGMIDYLDDVSNYKYYKFLKPKYILHFRWRTYVSHILFPLLATPRLARYIRRDVEYINLMELGEIDEKQIKQEADEREKGWCRQFNLLNLKEVRISNGMETTLNKTGEILEDMVDFCNQKGFRPILMIPPVSGELTERFSKEFLDAYLYSNIKKVRGKVKGVLDYWSEEEFMDCRFYFSSDFMNKTGRQLFTERLMNDVAVLFESDLSRNVEKPVCPRQNPAI